ncbi:hypothetical protein JYT74_02420 [Crocinitomix catalasitica]|nr:hypothetical protein [Crocinitomix catalasitica]
MAKIKNKLFLSVVFFLSNIVFGQAESICTTYIPISKGTILTYEDFDKKGKLSGSQTMEVRDVTQEDGMMKIEIHSIVMDKKGETTYETDYSYSCDAEVFKVSMETQLQGGQMEAYQDMDVEIDADDLEIPAKLEEGMELKDGHLEVKISSSGFQISNIKIDVFNRKVEKRESVETVAGTFECFKMTSSSKTKIGFINVEASAIEWIAADIGVIRSESYDKKGQLVAHRILSSIEPGN